MKNKILVSVLGVVVIGAAVWFFAGNTKTPSVAPVVNENVPAAPQAPAADSVPAPTMPAASGIPMAEVVKHNSADSCYIVVLGNVYDVTSFISEHPGGPEKILNLCGTDGTAAFERKHGGQPQPEQTLASFKIGVLAK